MIMNFNFNNPTHILFGSGEDAHIAIGLPVVGIKNSAQRQADGTGNQQHSGSRGKPEDFFTERQQNRHNAEIAEQAADQVVE